MNSITIRPAYADDELAIKRLAELDSASVPEGPLLLAEVEGELLAAISLRDQTVIADPFIRTADLVALLAFNAAQLTPQSAGERRRRLLSSIWAGRDVRPRSGLPVRARLPRSPA
ncbi:MAG: hypothetical protein ACYDHH_07735 [Solirubrobacteraceae bacterium]